MTEWMPKFMENDLWYCYDFEKERMVLTDLAPDEVKESYEEYVRSLNNKELM